MTAPHPIIPLVCARYKMRQDELLGYKRQYRYEVRRARHVAMYLLHTKAGLSYASVSTMFNTRETTVRDACIAVEDSRDDPAIDRFLQKLEDKIDAGNASLTTAHANSCVQGHCE